MKIFKQKNKRACPSKLERIRGFTLIETLIAIAILVTAIVGPLTISQKGLSSAGLAKDQISASYLAQEAIEFVRSKRDDNTLDGLSWLSGLSACIDSKCTIDSFNNNIESCTGNCPRLQFEEVNKFYGYNNNWEDSIFTREVILVPINDDELSIEVKIKWKTGVFDREFFVRENIFNWH